MKPHPDTCREWCCVAPRLAPIVAQRLREAGITPALNDAGDLVLRGTPEAQEALDPNLAHAAAHCWNELYVIAEAESIVEAGT